MAKKVIRIIEDECYPFYYYAELNNHGRAVFNDFIDTTIIPIKERIEIDEELFNRLKSCMKEFYELQGILENLYLQTEDWNC